MKTLIVLFTFLASTMSFAQKWEDCCWTKFKSGLEIKIVEKGKGKKIQNGDIIFIKWMLYDIKTGEVLVDNNTNSEYLEMEMGKNNEYYAPGYLEGIKTLKRGGSAFLKIPPKIAFGDTGYLGQTTLCIYFSIKE